MSGVGVENLSKIIVRKISEIAVSGNSPVRVTASGASQPLRLRKHRIDH